MSERADWQVRADEWAAEAVAAGDPTAWFERLYAAGRDGEVTMPWEHDDPHAVLADWLARDTGRPTSGRAAVVGCGLGADAEALAALGFDTVGFDVSASAIAEARKRHPDSAVDYVVADLLDLPQDWRQAFDLVVEIYTVQAVPPALRERMVAGVVDLVAPGGSLLAVQLVRQEHETIAGPPWPLTVDDIESFERAAGLQRDSREVVEHPVRAGGALWELHLRRP